MKEKLRNFRKVAWYIQKGWSHPICDYLTLARLLEGKRKEKISSKRKRRI